MKPYAAVVACLLALALGAPPAQADPLVDPAPISVPAGVDQDAVAAAIKQALMYRNWAITTQQPGRVDATLYLRGNEARIRLDYDADRVRIRYVGSHGLEEGTDEGVAQIHGRYLAWIQYLVGDITTNLQHSPRRG